MPCSRWRRRCESCKWNYCCFRHLAMIEMWYPLRIGGVFLQCNAISDDIYIEDRPTCMLNQLFIRFSAALLDRDWCDMRLGTFQPRSTAGVLRNWPPCRTIKVDYTSRRESKCYMESAIQEVDSSAKSCLTFLSSVF
jgi:hypothetical protein